MNEILDLAKKCGAITDKKELNYVVGETAYILVASELEAFATALRTPLEAEIEQLQKWRTEAYRFAERYLANGSYDWTPECWSEHMYVTLESQRGEIERLKRDLEMVTEAKVFWATRCDEVEHENAELRGRIEKALAVYQDGFYLITGQCKTIYQALKGDEK